MNLNLSAEQQRIFILIGVGVVAVAGLFLVTRGGGESSSTPSTPPAKSSPAQPGQGKTETSPSNEPGTGSEQSTKTTPESSSGQESAVKPSKQAYLDCVQQATSTAALEKCQAVLP